MTNFKPLDPELHLKMIEGYVDELTPEVNKTEAFYQLHRKCKRCDGPLQREFDRRVAWTGDGLLAKSLLRCTACGFLIDPFTNIVLDTGSAAKIPTPIMPEYKRQF